MGPDAAVVLLHENGQFNHREWIEAAQGLALLRRAELGATGHYLRTAAQREAFAASVQRKAPRLLFIAVGLHETASALALLNDLPKGLAKTTVAIGGTFGTLCSHEFTAHPKVGAVLLGEWVGSLVELAGELHGGYSGDGIKGVWWRSAHGWKLTEQRSYAPDLEQWPAPALEDFRAEEICRHFGRCLPLLASRGFPGQSLFTPEPVLRGLQRSEQYYYPRPPRAIVQEARDLRQRYRCGRFVFADDVFPWEKDWTEQFAAFWTKMVGAPFSLRSAAEHLTPEIIRLLARAGLERVEFSVETGNQKLRNRLSSENQNNTELFAVIDRLGEAGVETRVRLLAGVPQESAETLRETVRLAESCNATEVRATVYQPLPESRHWAEVEKSLSGHTLPRLQLANQQAIARDVVLAVQEIQRIQSLHLAGREPRRDEIVFSGVAEFAQASFRSQLEAAAQLTTFATAEEAHPVVALRVPSALAWQVTLPRRALLEFGLLLEPRLPGERFREPVSFSLLVRQKGKTWRLFQKILVQALDPDSRRWHWFKIPVVGPGAGPADLVLENMVYGQDASYIPVDQDIWAGWAKIFLSGEAGEEAKDQTDPMMLGKG